MYKILIVTYCHSFDFGAPSSPVGISTQVVEFNVHADAEKAFKRIEEADKNVNGSGVGMLAVALF